MRFPHWLKMVAGAFALSASADPVLAQGPGGPGAGQPVFQPAYGTSDPGVLYPQGVPYGYQPYPTVSPYNMGNVAWDQTFRDDDGLWFERILHSNREYFASIDATYNTIAAPGDNELGSPHIPFDHVSNGLAGYIIPTYGQGGNPGTQAGGGGNGQATGQGIPTTRTIVDSRVIPYPLHNGTGVLGPVSINNGLYPVRSLSAFSKFQSTGLQAGWGFFNEDGSGMSINGFWTGLGQQSFTMGTDAINGVKLTQTIIENNDGTLLYSKNGTIPLNWGFSTSDVLANVTGNLGAAKYDLLFHYDTKTSVIGGGTNFYMVPIVQSESVKLRPFIGGRYMSVSDGFHFRGIDSGFSYALTTVTVTGGGGGGGGGGGATAANTFRPDTNTLNREYDMYEATLTSNVRSNLAGPQVGFRYDFGEGEEFKMWGQSTAGLMANREDYHLYGNNLGDQMGLLFYGNGLDMLASDARFNSKRTLNHVSPLFEQSINAEMKILEMIPIVRNLPGVEDTVFRAGYTVTVVGGVARSGQSIDWRGFPLFPSIHPGRETWWSSQWNFGVERRF